jgi:hypothetical protein
MHLFNGFKPLGELDVAMAPVMLPAKSKATAVSQTYFE